MRAEQQAFLDAIPVSYETRNSLDLYEKRLIEWNEKFNLIAPSTIPHIWSRHFLDSAQLMAFIPEGAKHLADMGAGAGFPGLVLAVLAAEAKRDLHIHEIESTGKKADFLQTIADELKLKVTVRRSRIEDIRDLKADVITARALKALPELLKYANYLTHKDTVCLFLKGLAAAEELTQASKYWTFTSQIHPSCSDSSGSVLILKDLRYKTRRS